jgi:hypothetical protein
MPQTGFGQTVGVTQYTGWESEGYTLIAPMTSTNSYLIDRCGRVINSWTSDYLPGNVVYLLETGQLLRSGKIAGEPFSGGGLGGHLELRSWDDEVIWHYEMANSQNHLHHDVEYMANGNILVIAWDFHSNEEAISLGRNPNLLDDGFWSESIFELMPLGEEDAQIVWEWHFWDHLIQEFDPEKENYGDVSASPRRLNINFNLGGDSGPGDAYADWLHINSIDYHPELDQILLSSRKTSEIYIIDHSTTAEEAASSSGGNSCYGGDLLFRFGNPFVYGQGSASDQVLDGQHDAHWIDNSTILLYNNRPLIAATSSIEKIIPLTDGAGEYLLSNDQFQPNETSWSLSDDFFSAFISGVEQLPDNKLLVCNGLQGEIREYDEQENIIWTYVNPVGFGGPVEQGQLPTQNPLFRAQFYPTDFAAFNSLTLIPGEPLELNPGELICLTNTIREVVTPIQISTFPNYWIVNLPEGSNSLILTDAAGRIRSSYVLNSRQVKIDRTPLSSGVYLLLLEASERVFSMKLIN